MSVRIIGIDCATDAKKVGLAFGEWDGHRVVISHACDGADGQVSPVDTICRWILDATTPALLAIDAPLGWPIGLRTAINRHTAGASIAVAPNDMFRRLTDVCIQRRLGKTPLDVGADRIARTAHTALEILRELSQKIGANIPLAWRREESLRVSAIEVYPAALLASYAIDASLYKRPDRADDDRVGSRSRHRLLGDVKRLFTDVFDDNSKIESARQSPDALDAILCVIAGAEFLSNRAVAPADEREHQIAEVEGWIWAGRKTTLNSDISQA